jgi:hypothetical protein
MKMSTSVIPVLWPRKDKNGLFPVKIRITQNRKSSCVPLGLSIKKVEWSEHKKLVKSIHPDSDEINDQIIQLTEELEKQYIHLEPKKNNKNNFFEYLQLRIDLKKEGNKFFSTKRYQSLFFHLKKFSNNQPIYFTDFNKQFVVRFTSYLEKNIQCIKIQVYSNLENQI